MTEPLNIVYEDDEFVILNKPSGISTQKEKSGVVSLEEVYSRNHSCFVINRIDKRVSGLVIFAKNVQAAEYFGKIIRERNIQKTYTAIVAQKPEKDSARLQNYLQKDSKAQKARIIKEKNQNSQEAILKYSVLQSSERYHLLEIELETGRFHQIRAQMAEIGSPIVGDLKYGYKRSSPDGSIFLHCHELRFVHPKTKQLVSYKASKPPLWSKYGF